MALSIEDLMLKVMCPSYAQFENLTFTRQYPFQFIALDKQTLG